MLEYENERLLAERTEKLKSNDFLRRKFSIFFQSIKLARAKEQILLEYEKENIKKLEAKKKEYLAGQENILLEVNENEKHEYNLMIKSNHD